MPPRPAWSWLPPWPCPVPVSVTPSGAGGGRARTSAAQPQQRYRKELQAWQQRAAAHQQAELARIGQGPEWSVVSPPALRTDIFGGSLAGWQALLTTHGTSILAAGPLLVMDLSGQQASGELTAAARAAAVPAAQYELPADLGRCGLLSSLSPAQFADALTEAIHAGAPGGARTDRAVDVRVLEQLAAALGGWISPARLAAATQAALGHPVPPGLLSPQEEALIGGGLFPAGYQQQIGPNLVRLDAFLVDLARCTGYALAPPPPAPAYYTCLALEPGARSARAEMLIALAIGWLTVQVSASRARAPAVIIAGADEITLPHLERLAGACEHRQRPAHHHVPPPARGRAGPARRRGRRVHAPRPPRRSRASRQLHRPPAQVRSVPAHRDHGREPVLHPQRHPGLQRRRQLLPQLAGIPPRLRHPHPRHVHLPKPGPPGCPRPRAPAGATPRPPSGSTNTPSSPRSCRTSPTTPSCSPTAAQPAHACAQWNATPPSPPCPASPSVRPRQPPCPAAPAPPS